MAENAAQVSCDSNGTSERRPAGRTWLAAHFAPDPDCPPVVLGYIGNQCPRSVVVPVWPLFGRNPASVSLTISSRSAGRPPVYFSRSTTIEDSGSDNVAGVFSVRVWALVAVVSLGFTGASLAHPQDSPGTVYIDGVPCNLACQSYMAWSRKTLKASQAAAKGAANTSAAAAPGEALRKRISKRVEPVSADAPSRKKTGDAQAALPAIPEPPPLPRPRTEAVPLNMESRDPPAALTPAPAPPPVPQLKAENVPLNVEISNPPRERTPQQLVMAALEVAEQITNAETPKAIGDRTNETRADDANLSPPRDVGTLVAILISRPEVQSASALRGLNVAIDAAQSGDEQDISLALAAAGATETQLSFTDASPLHRMISGDVQAAVVKLVSRDAAEAFPDIKGFKVLRVPLAR